MQPCHGEGMACQKHSALLPALCSAEALLGGVPSPTKQELGKANASKGPLGKLHQGRRPLRRNPEDPQAQGKVEIRAAAAPEGGLEGPWARGAALPSLTWKVLRP